MSDGKFTCSECVWNELCEEVISCEHFCPYDDEVEEAMLDYYIENGRYQYRNEFFQYLRESGEDEYY